MIYGNIIGGSADAKVIQLEFEDGTTLEGVIADEAPVIDATPKDIMLGKTAVTNNGVTVGEREFLSYRTTRSSRLVMPGQAFAIPLSQYDKYDYTQLQCVIAKRNTTTANSVSVDRVVMYDKVYPVNSVEPLSAISKDADNKSINLNITNDTTDMYYIHYFTYKEEQL